MTPHELMLKTNQYLLGGGVLTDGQKANIVRQFLDAVAAPLQARQFYNGLKYSNNVDREGRRMYPVYFIPPYSDGKKLKTIFGQTPKTHIFSANSYELEIIRLLHLFAPENPAIKEMVNETLKRLKTTCFGYKDDGLGECFDTSLVVLRFLAAVAPQEKEWIQSRIDNYNNHASEKKRPKASVEYFKLCLKELAIK